ncbi:iron complex transport system permease protein [Paenibacillus barcinonensis]|uniref:Iron complex transport system permease protein n=2 Tax=Paenibacillus barcinonensis TaxID=198119 RepID=A0A2V4VUL3_PAEBA|nr:iron complex transport system permease protein [Paenibacillus barcinonensis]
MTRIQHPGLPQRPTHVKRSAVTVGLMFLSAAFILLISMFIAISLGAKGLRLETVWNAVFHYNPSMTSHQIIHELRLPRVLAAAVIGAAFAVAGALMQGITRNPLADTGILGINAGATFVVALSFAFWPGLPYGWIMLLSFIGAVLGTLLIFLLGMAAPGGLSSIRLTVAGAVIAAMLGSLSTGVAIYFDLSQDLAFWYAGGFGGIEWRHLRLILPALLLTLLLTMPLARRVSLMSLGEEVALNLGLNLRWTRILALGAVVVLAGVSVSAVGSIGFVGLVIPHMSRKLVGVDYRLIIPMSSLLGAILLVLADLGARIVNPPQELAVGIMVAFVGVPFFLYLARKERRAL